MKKFFAEFKKFISRGNVIDLAVGVIIGGAFSAIVTALTNQILMPLINWFLAVVTGGKGMEGAVTMLSPAYMTDEAGNKIIDIANSIYIDWGAFITAIVNFLLIAIVLFVIVKAINAVNDGVKKEKEKFAPLTKEEIKAYRKEGKSFAEIEALAREKAAAEEEAARIAEEEAKANAPKTQEQLLEEIAELLRNK